MIKICVKIFLLALIPVVLIIQLKFDAILPLIIYLQFLLIWSQAEIALKQHNLFAAQFEPSFNIISNTISSPTTQNSILSIHIKNTSSNPAYSISVTRVLENHRPIMPNEWKDKISRTPWINLSPKEEQDLCQINDVDFIKNKEVEILYRNQFGDFKEIYLLFSDSTPILIPLRMKEQGFLLNTFREIIELPDLLRIKRKLR